jgi:spore coat protein U-like protein
MYKIVCASMIAGLLVGSAAQAAGGSTSTSFNVTATVLSTCSASASAVTFPNYTPGAGPVTANGTITVKCTNQTPYVVKLNAGSTTGDAFTQRLMANGTNTLQYNLYTTAAFATVFGDTTGGTAGVTGTGAGVNTATTVTVYGQLPDSATNQSAVTGSYSDTITVTVTY